MKQPDFFKQRQQGFTLVELMITIVVMAILATIALPNMSNWLESRRVAGKAEQFANLMRFARVEAVRLNVPVYICPVQIKKDGKSDSPCKDRKFAQQGWMAYADTNRDGAYKRQTDIALRTFILNDNSNNLFSWEAQALPFSGGSAQVLMFGFRPNGAFGYNSNSLQTGEITWSEGHVLVELTAKRNDSKHEAKGLEYVLIDSSGRVDLCIYKDKRPACQSKGQQ